MWSTSLSTEILSRFGRSVVVDEAGNPLAVYRGEHGVSGRILETRLASLTFCDRETANIYASAPNDLERDPTPVASRVIPAYLRIERPFMNEPNDPFVNLSLIRTALGDKKTITYTQKFAEWIEGTNAWQDHHSSDDGSDLETLEEALSRDTEDVLQGYYLNVFPLLDCSDFVADLKAEGFDGAIYAGCGANFDKTEYRVFDPSQVISALAPLI